MSDIGIIIRMWHNDSDDMKWRYHYFAANVLPRLQRQKEDFEIWILSSPNYHKRLESLDSRIHCFTLRTEGFSYKPQGNFTFEDAPDLPHFKTQVRLDSDDLVSEDFLSVVKNTKGNVTFQPQLFLLDELRVKKMSHRYRGNKPSAFLALKGYNECIYHQVFLRFDATLIKEGKVWVTIHDRNQGSTKFS